MPNKAYQRSVRRERELVNRLRGLGYDACRSAGSKSPWDVWAVHPKTGVVKLYQIKTKKGGRKAKERIVNQMPPVTWYWIDYV